MAEERVQRRLLAILAADVVGYIRLMGVHGAAVSGAQPVTQEQPLRTGKSVQPGQAAAERGDSDRRVAENRQRHGQSLPRACTGCTQLRRGT